MKTLLKIGKLHVWMSGSMVEPYSDLYYNTSKTKCGYKSLSVFPQIMCYGKYKNDSYTTCRKFMFTNNIPKVLQYYFQLYYSWKYYRNFEKISLIKYIYDNIKCDIKIKRCKHPNLVCDSHVTPDTGSEDFYCPDCGFSQHICYY